MNKLKGVVLVVISALASIMMPFNIYADTIDSHIRGRNYTYEPITYTEFQVSTTTKYYQNVGVFHITFELDDEYIGYVLPNYTLQFDNYFYGSSTPNWGTLSKTFNRRVFVNGSSFSFDLTVNWNSITVNTAHSGDTPYFYDSYTFSSSDITKYADIDSLDQIVNILQDLYNSNDQVEGLLNDQLAQLQLVVSNSSLANQYLDTLSKLRQYNFPLESWFVNYPFLVQRTSKTFQSIYYWNYPVYDVIANTELCTGYNTKGNKTIYIFGTSSNIGSSNFNNYFSSTSNVSATFEEIPLARYSNYKFFKVTFNHLENGTFKFTAISNVDNLIHIYLSDSRSSVSTDFALLWGLSNQLLDDLHTIANGTTASNNASQQLDSDTSDFNTDRDDLIDIEDSMGDDMDSAMNQITPNNNGLSGFGGNFLTSAVWVRTQFERLTNNTPYGSLIVYGMTLGLALLLLGKVML